MESDGPRRSSGLETRGFKFKPKPKTESTEASQAGNSLGSSSSSGKAVDTDADVVKSESWSDSTDMDVDVKTGGVVLPEQGGDFMDAENGDEVVREIDVYFVPSFDQRTKMYVMQFPMRQKWRPYELDDKCEEVRVKPESREVEMDLRLESDSNNYEPDAVTMKKQEYYRFLQRHGSLNGLVALMLLASSKEIRHVFLSVEDKEWNILIARALERKVCRLKFRLQRNPMSDYLNMLCGNFSDNSCSRGSSMSSLLKLPLKDRFETYFLQGPPLHRFDALKHFAPDATAEDILSVLQELCRLVQGLWVPKSSLVYGTDHGNEVLARDYVLLLFTKNVCINNAELRQQPKLSGAMKEVLKVVAEERPAFNDWKLKVPPDSEFIKMHPEVVKKQDDEWGNIENNINELPWFRRNNKPGTKTAATSKSSAAGSQAKPKVAADKLSSQTRDAINEVLHKLFKRDKVCSFQQVVQSLRAIVISKIRKESSTGGSTSAAANVLTASSDELQAIINEAVVNIHGIGVLKSSLDHPEYNPFREVVIKLFSGEPPNAKLKRAAIIDVAKAELGREISKIECDKVLHELCVSQGSTWMLKTAADGTAMHVF
ncbi:hypothetical protein M569_08053 [Genlisea aurea]|uniref:DNA-directed RNA polymerase III subunit RPC5 n=1 Tax=Genlisea aurea TaxID=192259 RepID=S8DU42_9LAMI|nr:hypothetical protein M569_08053 [Genlisea aurea]